MTLGKPRSLSQAFNKKGFGPYVPPGRGWQGQIMEGFGVSQRRGTQKGFERGDDRVKFAPTAGVLALLVVSLSLSFLPGEMEIMISTAVRAVGFGLGQPWVQVFP